MRSSDQDIAWPTNDYLRLGHDKKKFATMAVLELRERRA
jgi:hypothetical protein